MIVITILYFFPLFFYIFPIIYDEFVLVRKRRRIYACSPYTFYHQIFYMITHSIKKLNTGMCRFFCITRLINNIQYISHSY